MISTVTLGGTASHIKVACIAHGLMRMTWTAHTVPDDIAFESIKQGVDAAEGAKVLLNAGEFYGPEFSTANLEMLARFFEQHPEYVERTVLCVKGATKPGTAGPDSSEENLRNSMKKIHTALRGTHTVDLFEPARVDKAFPIETIMRRLIALREEGHFAHIALSEISAATLARAIAVEGAGVASVEIEVNAWSYEDETKKVIALCAEHAIPVSAYSPMGRGFLTGSIRSRDDLKEGDSRRHFARFQPGAFENNFKLVEALESVARAKGVTTAQLAIAWVRSRGPHMLPLAGSSNAARTIENLHAANVQLSADEVETLDKIIDEANIQGERYMKDFPHLWG